MKRVKKKQKKLSLMEAFPSLAKEWHPVKNEILTPNDVKPTDFIHAWWICNLKHEWIALVVDRVNGAGCPFCPSVSRKFSGMITLAEYKPKAVEYWHKKKNGNRTPDQFCAQSVIKVWWKCEKGHEWYATIASMRYNPRCPYCYPGKGTSPDYNLAVKRPDLARQWHPSKNGSLLPTQIAPFSFKKVWWKCSNGHEWVSTAAARQNHGGCPLCARKKLESNFNLAVSAPQVIPFWHPFKNKGRTPANFRATSSKKVWWICEKGHEYQRTIGYMKQNQTCPVCRQLHIEATRNLKAENPKLAREWHPDKNGDLTPDKVRAHAQVKVWWLCPRGHEYQAAVGNRNRSDGSGRGCPYCSGRKDLSKESLAILLPELAKEWHPEKNGDLTPEKISTVSRKLVWWRCKNGHEWLCSVYNRVHEKKGETCPYCE
jgi:hypothetical protein